jgi:hypothetical protein
MKSEEPTSVKEVGFHIFTKPFESVKIAERSRFLYRQQ